MRERVYDRVDDRRGCGYGPRLSYALHAHRVGRGGGLCPVEDHVRYLGGAGNQVVNHCAGHQVAVVIIDGLLVEGLRYPLRDAAVQLAVHDSRVDHRPAVVHRHVLGDGHHPCLGVHLHHADVGPVRPGKVGRIEGVVLVEQWFHPLGKVVGQVSRRGDVLYSDVLIGGTGHGEASALELDVLLRRLQHVRRYLLALLYHLVAGEVHRDAPDREAAGTVGVAAVRGYRRVGLQALAVVSIDAQSVGGCLGPAGDVALAVWAGARDHVRLARGERAHGGGLPTAALQADGRRDLRG